jgi:hypothetical protein
LNRQKQNENKNMKFISKILTVGLLAVCTSAFAQLNLFQEPRTIALVYPQVVSTATFSNTVTDIHGYEGVAKVDICTVTNAGCSASGLTIYTSPDQTNWTALANFAKAVSNSVIYTNVYYSGGTSAITATNVIMYPGTITTPTASSAGWATKYLLPAPFTNTSLTLPSGLQTIGFVIPDQARYIQFAYTFTSGTNFVSATMTARKQQE